MVGRLVIGLVPCCWRSVAANGSLVEDLPHRRCWLLTLARRGRGIKRWIKERGLKSCVVDVPAIWRSRFGLWVTSLTAGPWLLACSMAAGWAFRCGWGILFRLTLVCQFTGGWGNYLLFDCFGCLFWRLFVLCDVVGAFLLLALIWLDLVCGWWVASPCWRSFWMMVRVKEWVVFTVLFVHRFIELNDCSSVSYLGPWSLIWSSCWCSTRCVWEFGGMH